MIEGLRELGSGFRVVVGEGKRVSRRSLGGWSRGGGVVLQVVIVSRHSLHPGLLGHLSATQGTRQVRPQALCHAVLTKFRWSALYHSLL